MSVPAGTALRVPLGRLGESLGGAEVLIASTDGSRTVLLGGTDRDFPDAPTAYGIDVTTSERTGDDCGIDTSIEITLTAQSLLRDTVIAVEEIDPDAHSDVNLLTLLPGESATWSVRTRRPELFSEERVRDIVRTARAAAVREENFRGLAALASS